VTKLDQEPSVVSLSPCDNKESRRALSNQLEETPMRKLALTTAAAALALSVAGAAYAVEEKGSGVEPGGSTENKGALTAPEKDTMGDKPTGTGGMTDESATNVPGADADQDKSTENPGSLSAPEKDKSKM
jgi:hypothetical protein